MSAEVFISTAPFAQGDPCALDMLKASGAQVRQNPVGRRLTDVELSKMIGSSTVLIAGTEPINERVLDRAPQLKLIARVGIGLDSVDLAEARRRGIEVSYTPDAPSEAVSEFTIGLILDLLRGVTLADRYMRGGEWNRFVGRRVAASVIGVIGVGRIGSRVIRHLVGAFPGVRILANDLRNCGDFENLPEVQWVEKEYMFQHADLISLHLPLTTETRDLIAQKTIGRMKKGVYLVNTSRGGVLNESDLLRALDAGRIAGAALDVFGHEPYHGPLLKSDRCVLTCHMGSMSKDCRFQMELQAAEDACRFLRGESIRQPVPVFEYELQGQLNGALKS